MKITKLIGAALLALASLALAPRGAQAANTTYTDGDLFLGFRADGGTQDFLVNLGQPSALAAASLPNVGAQLSTTFGADWYNRTDLHFSVIGGNSLGAGADPVNTIYASRPSAVPWPRRSDASQASTSTLITALGSAFADNASAALANSLVQTSAANNSYASFQPGGTMENSNGVSFSTFTPSNEGTPMMLLYLFRLTPSSQPAGTVRFGTVALSSTGAVTFTPAAPAGTIRVQFEQPLARVSEAGGHATLTLVRDGDTATAFTVNVTTASGTAHDPTDFTALTNTPVSFAVGQALALVNINVADVDGFQGNRTFTASLSSPSSGVTLGSPSTATVTILDNDPEPPGAISFALASSQTGPLDGTGNPKLVTLTLTRTGGSNGAVSVEVTATGGTLASSAYTVSSPVNFASGATSAEVSIQLNAIPAASLPGTIELKLSNPTGGATLGAQATTTLTVNAQGTVSFTSATYSVSEQDGVDSPLTISVTRSDSFGPASVEVAVTGGTATSPADFTLPATPVVLSWADGETGVKSFTLTAKSDALGEGAETVLLTLQNPTGSVTVGTPGTATVTILDADSTAPTLTLTTPRMHGAFTGALVKVTGKAKDDIGIGRVEIQVNGVLATTLTPDAIATEFDFSGTVVPEQGANTITVTAFDLHGNASTVVKRLISFINVRPALAGSYNGLIVADAAASAFDFSGLLNLKVTRTGVFTGKVVVQGTTIPLRGTVLSTGAIGFGGAKTATRTLLHKGDHSVIGQLALAVDPVAQQITGTIKDADGALTLATVPHADQALYNAATNPVPAEVRDPASEKGKYTALFQADPAPNNGYTAAQYPQGDGYGVITISPGGVVKIVGKLADGSAVAYSNTLSKTNTWPVYLSLYKAQGFLTGEVAFDSSKPTTDAAAPGMKWFKPAGLPGQVRYPDGWPSGITVDFVASKYLVPGSAANSETVLGPGLAAADGSTANVTVALADGGLPAATSDDASIYGLNKVKVVSAVPSAPSLKVTLVPANGLLGGSFKHPVTNANTLLQGVAYQKTNSAAGYFLFNLPAHNAPADAVASSGSVTILKKAAQ